MSDNEQLDVLIAVYLIPDLAQKDFDAYVKLAGDGEIVTDGVALVAKDADGEVHVQETGDHLGRKGAKVGGGVGLVDRPLRPAAPRGYGGRRGGGRPRREVRAPPLQAGIGEKLDDALPAGLGRPHRHLRPRRTPRRSTGARQRDPEVDRTDRQGIGEGAQGGSRGGRGRAGRLNAGRKGGSEE